MRYDHRHRKSGDLEVLREYVREKVDAIDINSFGQEPQYVGRLFGVFDGEELPLENGTLRFKFTHFDDRGRDSAETVCGADFAVIFQINDRKKVIFAQAKKSPRMVRSTQGQIVKMGKYSVEPYLFITPHDTGRAYFLRPPSEEVEIFDLFHQALLCQRGDVRPALVEGCQRSDFRDGRLQVILDGEIS